MVGTSRDFSELLDDNIVLTSVGLLVSATAQLREGSEKSSYKGYGAWYRIRA